MSFTDKGVVPGLHTSQSSNSLGFVQRLQQQASQPQASKNQFSDTPRSIEQLSSAPATHQIAVARRPQGALSKGREIRNRLEVLALAKRLGNVSEACRVAGISRDTFYRYQRIVEQEGAAALLTNNRRGPKLKNRVAPAVELAVLELAEKQPRYGQSRVAAELEKRGMRISPSGVRSVWLRHRLANLEQRLQALGDFRQQPSEEAWRQKTSLSEPTRDRATRSHQAAMISFVTPPAIKD